MTYGYNTTLNAGDGEWRTVPQAIFEVPTTVVILLNASRMVSVLFHNSKGVMMILNG